MRGLCLPGRQHVYAHAGGRTAGQVLFAGRRAQRRGLCVGVSRERTLAEWLTFAEDQTRRNIALLQEHGVDASPCAQMYGIARIKARRDVVQQIEGLVEFWSADLHARVLRLVSGLAQGEAFEPEQPARPRPSKPGWPTDAVR